MIISNWQLGTVIFETISASSTYTLFIEAHRPIQIFETYLSWPVKASFQGCTNFTKNQKLLQNSRRQLGDIKQVPYCGSVRIKRRTKFSHPDDLAPWIFVPQPPCIWHSTNDVTHLMCAVRISPEIRRRLTPRVFGVRRNNIPYPKSC